MSKKFTGLPQLLCEEGYLSATLMTDAINAAEQTSLPLITYLVKNTIVKSETILACCRKHFNLPIFDLHDYDHTLLKNSFLKMEMIYRYHIIPLKQHANFFEIGVADPTNQALFSLLSFQLGLPIKLMLVAEDLLNELINKYYSPNILHEQIQFTLSKLKFTDSTQVELIKMAEAANEQDEPVIEFVDHLIEDAVKKNISDIHIEPHANHCRIRFRRDGLMYEAANLPSTLAQRIIVRLKIMANLNIAERRMPQDGHIEQHDKLKIDIRINTCPTLFGEKIVLRLLQTSHAYKNIYSIGLNDQQLAIVLQKLLQPQGFILLTGPTGSGKTITLYAALDYLNKIEKNIISIENPVEIILPGINQINIDARIGLDFATVLRAVLRQDPDIMMIGEIRDKETALIATQAAQTGHLVMATLHANNALSALSRLHAIGVPPDQLADSLSLILAQRLLRRLCPHCTEGCAECHQGYQGRIGIFETLPTNSYLINQVLMQHELATIKTELRQSGHLFLWEAGLDKIKQGITNHAELLRVVGE